MERPAARIATRPNWCGNCTPRRTAARAEPSGSQDMIGLIYPGVNRLDYDFAHEGGIFPRHIESQQRPRVARWLEQVIHMLPVAPRPDGYNPLGVKNLDPAWIRRLGAAGQGLLRRDRGPRRAGPGRLDERVHGLLGSDSAANRAASDADRRPEGPSGLLPVALLRRDVFRLRRRLPVRGFRPSPCPGAFQINVRIAKS